MVTRSGSSRVFFAYTSVSYRDCASTELKPLSASMSMVTVISSVCERLTRKTAPWPLAGSKLAEAFGWTGTAAKRQRAKVFGFVTALVVSIGFSLVPLAVLAGIITK